MTTIDVSAIVKARQAYDALRNSKPDPESAPDYSSYVRAQGEWFAAVRDAYQALQRALADLPVVGDEITAIKQRHAEQIASMESSFRDLWNHPEFNHHLFSWVENMFTK